MSNATCVYAAAPTLNVHAARSAVYRGMEAQMPYVFTSGGLSPFHPLRQGSWVVVCKDGKLYMGEGEY